MTSRIDEHEVEDLRLFANNTGALYPEKLEIVAHLKKAIAHGTYSHEAAVRAWKTWVDRAATMYRRELRRPAAFGTALRERLAREVARDEKARIDHGDYYFVGPSISPNPLSRGAAWAVAGGMAIALGLAVYALWPKTPGLAVVTPGGTKETVV